jgi:hypothetical protein
MLPAAVVRYMIVCETFEISRDWPIKTNIFGLLTSLSPATDESYPLRVSELCIYVAVSESRGKPVVQVRCLTRPDDERVFESPAYELELENDPLQVIALPFRLRDCPFPKPGQYAFQFLYNHAILDERVLQLK